MICKKQRNIDQIKCKYKKEKWRYQVIKYDIEIMNKINLQLQLKNASMIRTHLEQLAELNKGGQEIRETKIKF